MIRMCRRLASKGGARLAVARREESVWKGEGGVGQNAQGKNDDDTNDDNETASAQTLWPCFDRSLLLSLGWVIAVYCMVLKSKRLTIDSLWLLQISRLIPSVVQFVPHILGGYLVSGRLSGIRIIRYQISGLSGRTKDYTIIIFCHHCLSVLEASFVLAPVS